MPPPSASLTGKRLFSVLFSVTIILLLASVFVGTAAAHTISDHSTSSWTEWNTNNALPSTSGSYYLTTDVTLDSWWDVPVGDTSLCLNGYVISLDYEPKSNTGIAKSNHVINLRYYSDAGDGDKKLTIYDCGDTPHYFTVNEKGRWILVDKEDENTRTLKGGVIAGQESSNQMHVIYVDRCSLEINGGYIIGGTYGINLNGSYTGVDSYDESSFVMNGGNISGNGHGIDSSMSSITMNDGTITENRAYGVDGYKSTFTMENGDISYNGRGVSGGFDFTMNDGVISHNTYDGVFVGGTEDNPSTFIMNGGTITENLRSGVNTQGHFTMNNGYITKNDGGVRVSSSGTFTLNNGEISGNEQSGAGGGVSVSGGTFIMEGGKIIGNHATAQGGGIDAQTVIARYTGEDGEVIERVEEAVIDLRGGIIKGNTAGKQSTGDGIWFEGEGGEFIISNSIVIDADNEVYIWDKYITVAGDRPFTGSVLNITWNGNNIKPGYELIRITSTAFTASDIESQFNTKNKKFILRPSADNKNLMIVGLPVVDEATVSISPYNSTVANVSFKLTDRNDATSVYVNLTNTSDITDIKSVYVTKLISAGTGLTDIRISGLTPKQTYTLTITPQNSEIPTSYIYIHPKPYTSPGKLTISTVTLQSGIVGTAYSFTLAKEGGETAIWSLKAGDSLPGGLTLTSNGVIQGTPTKAETKTFNVTVESRDEIATKEFSLEIVENPVSSNPTSPQGSSVWLTESTTPTPTETQTQTEPMETTQPTQPSDNGNDEESISLVGIIGVMVGLLIVIGIGTAVILRRR